jgi:hypothetical protein
MKNTAIKGKYIPKNKSKFNKSSAVYRSMWERRFMIYCDRSDNVLEWNSESIHIPYVSPKDDRLHNYYPDFYVKYKDVNGNTVEKIIEIKPQWQKKWSVNKAKWKAAKEYCKEHGYKFQVLTEKELF